MTYEVHDQGLTALQNALRHAIMLDARDAKRILTLFKRLLQGPFGARLSETRP
jgi:hypothetical protein